MSEEDQMSKATTINHIGLAKRIKESGARRIIILAPRRSGKTSSIAVQMASLMVEKPWQRLKYRALTEHLTTQFRQEHPHLFRDRGGNLHTEAHFLDEGLFMSLEYFNELISRGVENILVYSSVAGSGTAQETLLNLIDLGFTVIEAPLCVCVV